MTDREKAIVMAYTGICMLTGDKFQIFHKYVEDTMGRPIMTHEIGWLADTIKEKSKADFMALCADESSSEKPNKWIPVSEGLPEEHLCDDGYVKPSDYVLVCGDNGNYCVSRYWGNRRTKSESRITYEDWPDLDWVAQKPIAWMPLPDPFESKESEEV